MNAVLRAGGRYDMSGGGFGPLAAIIKASEGANGAQNFEGGRHLDTVDVFKNFVDDNGDVLLALLEQAGGACVAVEGAVIDLIFFIDVIGVAPVEEIGFDDVAMGMLADLAEAAVAFKGELGDAGVVDAARRLFGLVAAGAAPFASLFCGGN